MSHTGYASLTNTIIIKIILHTYLSLIFIIKKLFYKDYGKKNCCRKLEDEQEPAGGHRSRKGIDRDC